MIRHSLRTGLFVVLAAFLAGRAYSQPSASDRIDYRDRNADGVQKSVRGELKELRPGVFQVMSGGKAITDGKVPIELTGADIIRVLPNADLPGLSRDNVLNADGLETGKDYAKAKPLYEGFLKAPDLRQPTKQFLETRLYLLRARLLEEGDDDARMSEGPPLAADLNGYLDSYTKGWEIWPIGRALARLHADSGKFNDAARTWAKLAKSEALSKDLRDEATLREIDALIRDGKVTEAAPKAADLAKTPPASAGAKDRLGIFQAVCAGGDIAAAVKKIEEIIGKTKDPLARATGYAMIGELNFAAKKYRDAMWAYLWVEVVFNQDRDEVLNAMARLAVVFDALGDKERAESYKDRIRKYRSET